MRRCACPGIAKVLCRLPLSRVPRGMLRLPLTVALTVLALPQQAELCS